jgi:hypothetical protein
VERTDTLSAPYNTVIKNKPGDEIIIVHMKIISGYTSEYAWQITNSSGGYYHAYGAGKGVFIFLVPKNSTGLTLYYSRAIQIPLDSFLQTTP